MKTKFIGLEGFNEIESLSTTKKRTGGKNAAELSTAPKTVRFIKRAAALAEKSIKAQLKKSASVKSDKQASAKAYGKKSVSSKRSAAEKQELTLLDKCYNADRTGELGEFSGSVREAMSGVAFKTEKKFAHSAPASGRITAHSILRKKAILAVVASILAISFSYATVASALDAPQDADTQTGASQAESSFGQQSAQGGYSYGGSLYGATADEAMDSLSNEAYISVTKELVDDNIMTDCAGLYIDGELIGATTEADALNAALGKLLADYRADYDDETTTVFANDVEIRNGQFDSDLIMSANEIMNAADGKLSIALSTDIVYTRDIEYDTKTEYDDSKSASYEKVKTKGKNGREEVTVRTTYVDGVQVNAVETDRKTLKKSVDKVVVKGSKNGGASAASSSKSSSQSYSSSGTFIWPMPYTHTITSYFEWRWGRMHQGIDISAGGIYGQSIAAADGGTVIHSGDDGGGYGNYVIIDHGNGYQTVYAHCSSLAVSQGEYVSQGQTVGYVGSTGNSTGPHLHFEVRYNNVQLNPLEFVS